MKSFLILIVCLLGFSISNAQKQLVVDANAEQRAVTGSFDAIKVSGAIELYLSQSDQPAIAVSASEAKYKDAIKTVIENNVLKVYYDGDKLLSLKNKKLIVYVSFRELKNLHASGACNVKVSGTITSKDLALEFSGASDFKGDVSVGTLNMQLSGASDITITGRSENTIIESSGASDIKGYDLKTNYSTVKAAGASDVHIYVNKEISVQASGASNVYYSGEGIIVKNIATGASTVARKDARQGK